MNITEPEKASFEKRNRVAISDTKLVGIGNKSFEKKMLDPILWSNWDRKIPCVGDRWEMQNKVSDQYGERQFHWKYTRYST